MNTYVFSDDEFPHYQFEANNDQEALEFVIDWFSIKWVVTHIRDEHITSYYGLLDSDYFLKVSCLVSL